jgi:hypothetical protein
VIKNAATRAFLTLATAAALIGGSAVAASASAPRPEPTPTVSNDVRTVRPVRLPVLYDVDTDSRRGCDRLTFYFRGDDTPDVTVRRVRTLREDPSGRRVRLPGRDFLLVRFDGARTSRLPRGTQFTDLDEVLAWRLLGSFEGVVTVGVGLDERGRYSVRTFDDRVVLTVCGDDEDRPEVRPVR